MLRARKDQFALSFRVLSNQYVERSAYANVFKCNRKNKRFERAKVNSRWFCWFSVAILEFLGRAPTWRLRTEHYNFQWNPFRITRVRNIAHPRNFARCLFITLLRYLNFLTRFIERWAILFFIKLICVTWIQVLCSWCTVILKIIARNFAFSYLQWPWIIFKDTFNVINVKITLINWFYNIQLP